MSAAAVSAQDMAAATETYNNGATSLSMGQNATALDYFKSALEMASACGDEGTDIVNNCKDIIPKIVLAVAKDNIQASEFDKAVTQLNEAIKVAGEYGNADVAAEAKDLIPQVFMQKANNALNKKDFAGAIEGYKQAVAIDSTNGMASLRLGMAFAALGKAEDAEKAFGMAMRNGQQSSAVKQLSNMYVKLAAASLKTKNYEKAISDALKSFEYLENPTAMKVAGTAAAQLKKNKEAIEYLESYTALSPKARDLNNMFYTIAVLAQTEGDNAKACGYYKKIAADPKYGEAAKQQIAALKCE